MRIHLPLLSLVLTVGCTPSTQSPASTRQHPVVNNGPGAAVLDDFDFQRNGPLEFLGYLRARRAGRVSIHGFHQCWIQPCDVSDLIKLLDDTTPCAAVTSSYSSQLPAGSTVGRESLFLIVGFKAGCYPPHLDSNDPRLPKPNEVVEWWKTRNIPRGEHSTTS